MKNILLLLGCLFTVYLSAQPGIYSVFENQNPINVNIQNIADGEYNISGAHQNNGYYNGFISKHEFGVYQWSFDLEVNGQQTIISDQTELPNGNLALTGIYYTVDGTTLPFVVLMGPGGNILRSMAFKGLPYIFSQTHKIIYSEFGNYLVICGANRTSDPLSSAFSSKQMGFTIAVRPDDLDVVWSSFMDTGESLSGLDYDLIEDLIELEDGRIAATGSMNNPNDTKQLLMVSCLDPDNGTNNFLGFSHGIGTGPQINTCGASLLQVYEEEVLVLANSDNGALLLSVDLNSGTVLGDPIRFTSQNEAGETFLQGYKLDGFLDEEDVYVGGYLNDPVLGPDQSPYYLHLEALINGQFVLDPTGVFFQTANNPTAPVGAYTQSAAFEYVNTPEMFISPLTSLDFRLAGMRDSDKYEIDHFGGTTDCNTPCFVQRAITPALILDSIEWETELFNLELEKKSITPKTFERTETIIDECQGPAFQCDPNCDVLVTQVCATTYSLELDCLDNCYKIDKVIWNIPDLCVVNEIGSMLNISDFGGSYTYDADVVYIINGLPDTCSYSGNVDIPIFDCASVGFSPSLTHLGGTMFEFNINPNIPLCNVNYCIDFYWQDWPAQCWVTSCGASPSIQFDALTCGVGWYFYDITVTFTDACGYSRDCVRGNKIYLDYPCQINPTLTAQSVLAGSTSGEPICPSGSDYLEITVLDPLNTNGNNCYLYLWNGVPGGPVYYCCYDDEVCDPVSLEIIDTCNGCRFFTWNVIDYMATREMEDSESIPVTDRPLSVSVYPNPVSDVLNIENNVGTSFCTASVFNLNGQLVLPAVEYVDKAELNVSTLPSGAYMIRIQDVVNGAQEVIRFIKM
ncbi:MAG: T9SS type A sorting domain-containing protein [Bacteroidetes bacterium]|nr:T9SS type A sorting domain-containing protein [Bacteroidota bacterium]